MTQPLSVIFCWHMHQPFYREADSGQYHLPWVYLHATKDYTDMAAILHQVPQARAVVNFVPSLTAQIEDYASRIRSWLDGGIQDRLPDPLLAALVADHADAGAAKRQWLLDTCFRLNHQRNLYRYPAYSRLWNLAEQTRHQQSIEYLGGNYFSDLVTWYHLGWLGETVRHDHFVARRLIEKGSGFNAQDRRDLLTLIAGLLHDVAGSYRTLAEKGQIELSTTPYAHPIMPLMIDFETARETVADALIPATPYPGGLARAEDHITLAKASHARVFGQEPMGCWPAEGSVSDAAVSLLGKHGFSWCATGEAVLHHSLKKNIRNDGLEQLYQPWLVDGRAHPLACFFRDDRLSDLIGFEYSRWDTHDAVANFMHELGEVRARTRDMKAPVVSIIMDGENAWEHYHENGVPFLKLLYQSIVDHPEYALTTFSDYLGQHPAKKRLPHLVPGSWVYGNFATWIGDAAKTRGWELLIEAKQAFDTHYPKLPKERQAAAIEQLRICEGSDWCWWFGDYNPGPAVRDFDRLYRQQLTALYHLLDVDPPASLETPISEGGGEAEGGGTMRRGGADS